LDGLRGQDSPECGRAGLSGHHALQRRLVFGDVPCPALIGFGTRDKRCYGCYAAAGEGFGPWGKRGEVRIVQGNGPGVEPP